MADAGTGGSPTSGGGPSRGAVRLSVYVTASCAGCVRARELVEDLLLTRPGAQVATVDLDRLPPGHALPSPLVGTPTYVLDGRVRWLGNPSMRELLTAWDAGEAGA